MDNLTHSLVGAALAEAVLPAGATPARRRLFLAVGVLAANLPDADLVYVGITPAPLGYLLHHRGHTHTLVGLVAQGILLAAGGLVGPVIRRPFRADKGRLLALLAAALLTHVLLDATNTYGVHPFPPFDSRWYYGDAVFILEPWLWTLLGVPLAMSAAPVVGVSLAVLLALLPVLMAAVGVVGPGPLAVLAVSALALGWWMRPAGARRRAAAALAATAAFIVLQLASSAAAKARTRAILRPTLRGEIVDVALNPNPADPLCWTAIAIEKHEPAGEYVIHRGTLALVPALRPATSCASYRYTERRGLAQRDAAGAWETPIRQSLQVLRAQNARDCWVQAWLQFGRIPALGGQAIRDVRFDDVGGENFTALRLRDDAESAGCPPHPTAWTPPREDLLRGER